MHNGHGSDHPRGSESLPLTDRDLEPEATPATQSPAQEGAEVSGIVLFLFHAPRLPTASFLPPNITQRQEVGTPAAVVSSHAPGGLEAVNSSEH